MLPPTDQMGEKGVRPQQCHLSVLLLAYVVIKWWSVNHASQPRSMNEKERMLHAEECVCVCAHSHMEVVHGCHGDCVACEHIEYAEKESLEISGFNMVVRGRSEYV